MGKSSPQKGIIMTMRVEGGFMTSRHLVDPELVAIVDHLPAPRFSADTI
jgi:hypothetical protein